MKVMQNLAPQSRYSVKCPHEMEAEFIVVHNTANDASAANEIKYMIGNNNQVSYHYAIDDTQIIQGIPENRNTWNAEDGGKGKGNRKGLSIEICYSKTGGAKFIEAEKLAAKFIASKLKEKGWKVDKVTKHQDYSGKYCPHRTLDMGWVRFLNMVKAELDVLTKPPTSNQGRTHTVAKGESLWVIAAKLLKNGSRYKEIRELNGLKSDTIQAGQVLKIPAK